jgi:ribose transport system substrate-binding protein
METYKLAMRRSTEKNKILQYKTLIKKEKKMKRPLLILMVVAMVIALVATIGLSGCKTATVAETTAAATTAAAETTAAATTAAATTAAPETTAAKKLVFGNLPTSLSDEWNGFSVENFKFAAASKGVEVQVIDAAWDGAKQLANLEDLISKGVDAISVFVWTPESGEQYAEKAKAAGIPIFFENTKLSSDLINYTFKGDYVFNVACEYDNIGYEAIKWLDTTYPGCKILYVRGQAGMGIVEAYEAGVEKAIKESTSGTTVAIRKDTQWDTQTAQPVVADVIASGEKFDAIFANNEPIAQGCYNALKDAGMEGTIPIIATGGGPTGIKQFDAGIINATVASPVSLQGLWLFKAMWLFTSQGITPPDKFIALPNMVITKDNLDENIPWPASEALFEKVGGLDSW